MLYKKIKRKIFHRLSKEFLAETASRPVDFSDISDDEWKTINEVKPFTLTGPERIVSLMRAVEHIEKYSIEGSIVECGVWKGGSIMAALKVLCKLNSTERDVFLYDTFEGMNQPTEKDESVRGESAVDAFFAQDEVWNRIVCLSYIEEVKKNMSGINYPMDQVHFIKGKVEETIPNHSTPEKIALLRLDTDWYESTLHELEHLFPRVVSGGIIIIDDYGHWKGCQKAVDEYFARNHIELFLTRVDYTCRIGVKK